VVPPQAPQAQPGAQAGQPQQGTVTVTGTQPQAQPQPQPQQAQAPGQEARPPESVRKTDPRSRDSSRDRETR
jgi:hypothetical protein